MATTNIFSAGPARALFILNNQLVGIGQVLNNTGVTFDLSSEEIRGGQGNKLYGRYFHSSSMSVEIENAMFQLWQVGANLGVDVQKGGLSIYESAREGETVTTAGQIALTNDAQAIDGSLFGWYKKPSDADWTVGTITGKVMTVPNAVVGETYCIKYFYNNPNADSIDIHAQYVPKVIHLVLINDLFTGDSKNVAASASKYGRLITDIPNFQLNGTMDLSWAATSAAPVSLSGTALAYDSSDTCEEDALYGTMTQEIFGAKWQDEVKALAVDGDVEITTATSETLKVYAVFGGTTASRMMDNSYFTFAVETTPAPTATGLGVTNEGVVSATGAGTGVVSVTLTGYPTITASTVVTVS